MKAVPMNNIFTLARHEVITVLRSKILLALIAIFTLTTAISVLVASYVFKAQVADYNAYVQAAQAAGVARLPPSPLHPLQLLRGSIEYIEIVGTLIAIAIGYAGVVRERSSKTMRILMSRPISTWQIFSAKILGTVAMLTILIVSMNIVAYVSIGAVSGLWLQTVDLMRLGVASLAAIAFLTIFYCLGAAAAQLSKVPLRGFMVGIGFWLIIVMIAPQIGDTMDPDNQVPGGLFNALQVQKAQEKSILAHFAGYEAVRNGIEEISVEKHYERFVFAVTGIKDIYNGKTMGFIVKDRAGDLAWLVGGLGVASGVFLWSLRRKIIIERGG